MTLNLRKVIGFEGYWVSDKGEVFSRKTGTLRKLSIFRNSKGYSRVGLMLEGKQKQVFVHRLVAEAFIKKIPKSMYVNHIDGNKSNNCLNNLEIVTHQENVQHSHYILGNDIKPVLMLGKQFFEFIQEFPSLMEASRQTGVDNAAIYKVCSMERNFAGGYSWIFKEDFNEINISKKIQRLTEGQGRKKVCQVDPASNEVIHIFDGIRVAERALGLNTIKHCVSGRTKTAGGYKWRYLKKGESLNETM